MRFFSYSYCCVSKCFAWKLCGCAVRHVVLLSFSFGFHFGICKSYTHFQVQCASKSLSWCAVCVWVSLFSIYSCSRVRPNENGNRTTSIHSTYLSKLHQKTYEKDNAIYSFHCESHVHRIGGKERREKKERICGHLNFSFAALFSSLGEKKVNVKIQSTFFLLSVSQLELKIEQFDSTHI